ncbi:MAG: LrgB family protein [Motiliproteus sp.]|nr:LrgB family protein [Motiliproteus sp.]MCW9053654.1 LrgB family protein [Motiliproteus sp.]
MDWLLALNDTLIGLILHLADSPLLPVAMTLVAFQIGIWLFNRLKHPAWLPPIVSSGLILVGLILLMPIDYNQYFQGARWISFLLGPATVALAIPLFLQFHHIRQLFMPITITLFIGAPLAAGLSLAIAWMLGADLTVILSLAPKSVTAPIAVSLAEILGGIGGLAVGIVAITGVIGSVFTPIISRWLKCEDERVIGFIMGMNGHGIATARAFEISPKTGAFSSLAMGLTGIFTAILLPLCYGLMS